MARLEIEISFKRTLWYYLFILSCKVKSKLLLKLIKGKPVLRNEYFTVTLQDKNEN